MQHLLRYGMVTLPMFNISKYLDVSAIFLKSLGMANLMQKSDEGIFLGYSTRSKAYKCLNANTNKVVESANVNFDEHAEVQNNESIKKPKEHKSFVYFYEEMPNEEDATNQIGNQQKNLVSAESQPVNVELHSNAKL